MATTLPFLHSQQWSSQRTSGAQSLRRGHSLPPSTKDGGNFTPTTTLPTPSARATTNRSMTSLPMSYTMTLSSSPSLQPFLLHEKRSIKKGERDAHQQKGTCRRIRARRVGQRHRPRAPNPLKHLLCGGRHRPRASNQSTGWA